VPIEGGTAQTIYAHALAARAGGRLAPEIVIDSVSAGLDGIPLAAMAGQRALQSFCLVLRRPKRGANLLRKGER